MMLRDANRIVNGRLDSSDPRVGVLASEIPVGFATPAFLLNDVDAAFPNRLYSLEILTLPEQGTLYLNKAGVGSFSGAPDGVYPGTQRVEKFDPGVGIISRDVGTYSITVGSVAVPVPVVIGVTVSPSSASGSQQFTATVHGENEPSQLVTWSTDGGQIGVDGLFIEPARTLFEQTITVRATSVFDPTKWGEAIVAIPALPGVPVNARRSVSITMGEVGGPAASLSGLMVSLHAAKGPHSTSRVLYQSDNESTDENGVLSFSFIDPTFVAGESALLSVLMLDGRHYLGLVKVD